jgi:hypothetical protein
MKERERGFESDRQIKGGNMRREREYERGRDREREKDREVVQECVCATECALECVHVRERKKERV